MTFALNCDANEMGMEEDFYIGLLFECPFVIEIDDCPFKNIRLLEVKQRIELHYKMHTSDLIYKHQACIRKREGDKMIFKEEKFNLEKL